MAVPNPHLEAVFRQSRAQGGLTSAQDSQLRAAVMADPGGLDLLNGLAASGRLRSFAVDSHNGTLIGSFDKRAGLIELPAASFRGRDLDAVVGVQALIADFAHKNWQDASGQRQAVTQDMVGNLQATFNGSPALAAQLKSAVARSHVQHFSLLGNGMAAGATYDGSTADGTPKGINLPPAALQSRTPGNPGGMYNADDLTFVLGHEIQHGFNNAAKSQATLTFLDQVRRQAVERSAIHDYTDELRAYIGAGRADEAKAEIAGWNALLDRQRQARPHDDGLALMLDTRNDRVLDFIRRDPSDPSKAIINPGLTFNPDGSLSPTPANIAAMGRHYFDRPSHLYAQAGQRPVALGEGRPTPTADYTNYYGTWALERIVAAEDRANVRIRGARPQIAIDMAGLGLKEDLIEREGLDLGANRSPRPYLDTSRTPAMQGRFHHTQDGSMGHDHRHVPVADHARIGASGDAVVDAWIDALQTRDDAAARAVQRAFLRSEAGQQLWPGGLDGAPRRAQEAQALPPPHPSRPAEWSPNEADTQARHVMAEFAQPAPQAPHHAMER